MSPGHLRETLYLELTLKGSSVDDKKQQNLASSIHFNIYFLFVNTDCTGHVGSLESQGEIVMGPVFAELKLLGGILHLVQIRKPIDQNQNFPLNFQAPSGQWRSHFYTDTLKGIVRKWRRGKLRILLFLIFLAF